MLALLTCDCICLEFRYTPDSVRTLRFFAVEFCCMYLLAAGAAGLQETANAIVQHRFNGNYTLHIAGGIHAHLDLNITAQVWFFMCVQLD